jgi:hypothetical protein
MFFSVMHGCAVQYIGFYSCDIQWDAGVMDATFLSAFSRTLSYNCSGVKQLVEPDSETSIILAWSLPIGCLQLPISLEFNIERSAAFRRQNEEKYAARFDDHRKAHFPFRTVTEETNPCMIKIQTSPYQKKTTLY